MIKQISEYVTADTVHIISLVVLLITVGLFTFMLVKMAANDAMYKKYVKAQKDAYADISDYMLRTKSSIFSYSSIETFLKKKGGTYRFKGITPMYFLGARFVLAVMFLIFALINYPVAALPAAIIGFFLPVVYIEYMNSCDNGNMIEDIKSVYDTLKLQSKAGVYISSALLECYLVVKHPRLKQALREMSSEISSKQDIEAAVDEFTLKFNNPYLVTLGVIIKQSLETGRAAKAFDDINAQIVALQQLINERERRKIKQGILLTEFMIYGGVIGTTIFVAVAALLQSMGS